MALSDYKITDNVVSTQGVVAAPDKLTGTANQNKMIFDRLIREAVKGLYNGLIDALAGAEGAAEIGLDAEGLDAETVAEGIAELAAELSTKAEAADVTAALALKADASALDAHTEDTGNPHSVSKAQVGLGNVDNTSDTDKPISTATQAALDGKQDALTFDTTPTANSTNPVTSGGVKTALDAKLSRSGGTMSGAIAMGSNKITGIGTPTEGADAATKQYVDDGLSAIQDIYFCTYGTTTHAQIAAALAAGKLPVCAVYDGDAETSVVYPYTDSYNDMLDMATVYRFQLAYRDADGGVVIKGLKCRHNDEWDTFEASLQDKLTFDTTPTANSTKPVTSAGIKTALDAKQSKLTFDSSPTSGSNNPVKSSGIKTAIDDSKPIVITQNGLSVASACTAAHSGLLQGRSVYVEIVTYRSGGVADTLRLYLTNEVMRAGDQAYYFGSFVDGTLYGIKLSRSSGWGELTEIPLGGA